MKSNKTSKYFIPCLTILVAAMAQAHAEEETGTLVSGEITPKLVYFNYSGGPGADMRQQLQAYSAQESWSGDADKGFYGDLGLNLAVGDVLTLERQGLGLDNHRGRAKVNTTGVAFTGYYSQYRSNSGSIDYLTNPNLLPADNNAVGGTDATYIPALPATNTASGYVAQFNNDAGGQTNFETERTNYGLAMKLKPELVGGWGSVSINYDGYQREGNKFATWIAGGSDLLTPPLTRWRGYDKPIDETMNKVSLNLTASPKGLFTIAYDGSMEKFDNQAAYATMDYTGIVNGGAGKALHFSPDSSLMTHAIRLSKTFDKTAVAAGYGMSRLEQDSFTAWQTARNYTTGKISTDNAYLNLNHQISPAASVEGHVKYYSRDNDSTFPAGNNATFNNFISVDGGTETLGVRINNIESMTYGLSASFRGLPAKSSLTVGWKREDIDRDLTFNTTANGIKDFVSLYDAKTESDEVYLKWSAKPKKGMTLRVTPSYISADKTGLVTEAEKAFHLKTQLGYAMVNGMHLTGYYNYKDKQNGNQTLTDKLAPADVHSQQADSTFHSAGMSLNLAATEKLSTSVSLDWMQNDFETYYLSSDRRRFEANTDFLKRGDAQFNVDTWSLSLNSEYQANDRIKLSVGYTFSNSDGQSVTVDTTQAGYTVRENLENTLHSLILGADYALKKGMTLRVGYVFDKYDDKAYDPLSGKAHTVMVGLSFKL